MVGRIKIHRQIKDWERYHDNNVVRVFFHLLLTVNREEKSRKGITIPRGSIVTSRAKLSEQCNLSEQQIKTVLSKLKSTSEITTKATNKYTIINIVKYGFYQGVEMDSNQQNNQQRKQQITTTKEVKKKERKKTTKKGDFEELWKTYPHARQAKKKDTKSFRNQCKEEHETILQQARYLKRQVRLGIQEGRYVKSMERRMRDFVVLEPSIVDQFLLKATQQLQAKPEFEEFETERGGERLKKIRDKERLRQRQERKKQLLS